MRKARVDNVLAWHENGSDTTACEESEGFDKRRPMVCTEIHERGFGCDIRALVSLSVLIDDILLTDALNADRKPVTLCIVPDHSDDYNDYGCP